MSSLCILIDMTLSILGTLLLLYLFLRIEKHRVVNSFENYSYLVVSQLYQEIQKRTLLGKLDMR